MNGSCPACRKPAYEELPGPISRCAACGFVRQGIDGKREAVSGLPDWIRDVLVARAEDSVQALLEVGCGAGQALEQARALGLEVMGVESDSALREQAQGRLPGAFIVESVEMLPPHEFGFVLMGNALDEADDLYAPFHVLFRTAAITARTTVMMQLTAPSQVGAARNRFTKASLTALFRLMQFKNCMINENEGSDGTSSLRVVAHGSDFVHFMQERYVPGTWSELTDYEHRPRYSYARKLAAGQDVLDFGCGTGYGSRILAETAQSVLAVDIDEAALGYATSSHQADNLEFTRNIDLGASLDEKKFGLITCFEVIEHVTAAQQKELLSNFQRLLKPDGVLLISTPNPAVTALYGDNPYHLHEMGHDDFAKLLHEIFPHVQMFSQSISAAVVLLTEDQEIAKPVQVLLDDEVFPGQANTAVYVAACANAVRPPLPSILYQDHSRDFIASHMEMLHQRNLFALERLRAVQQHAEMNFLRNDLSAHNERLQTALHERGTLEARLNDSMANATKSRAALQEARARLNDSMVNASQLHAALQEARARLNDSMVNASQLHSALQETQVQAAHFRWRVEQIEASTSWRALRRAQPVLAKLRPALRPPLRLAYRVYRRLHNRPRAPLPLAGPVEPVWQPRNLSLELRLEPVWNEAANRYELHCDKQAPQQSSKGWVKPYHVVPFHKDGASGKRVLHIIPNVFVGGSTQLVIDLAQSLPRPFTHEIMTAALWQGGEHTGINVHHVPTPDSAAMALVLDNVRPDLVHVHYWGLDDEAWYQAALTTLRGRSLPVVQNVNTPIAPLMDPVFNAYVFVSQYVLDRFGAAAKASGTTVEVIHPGIDLKLFESQSAAPDAQNAIGMVYRLEQDKLNETSIELLIEVVKRRPRTRAYVVGGGSLLQPYLERTEQAGVRENFRFTGYVPYEDLPRWYEQFRIFVAPVWKESFGQVAPFAMSKGCAVTGYDIGALAEILGSHDTLGRDTEETASIILELLDNPDRLTRMGKENHLRAQALFGLPKMIEHYAAVYDALTKK